MPGELRPKAEPSRSVIYQIKVKGQLGAQWTEWFAGLTVTLAGDGDTLLTGPLEDQAALHGVLNKVRNLGIPLVSVCALAPRQCEQPGVKPGTSKE